jgi:hypothetical protein
LAAGLVLVALLSVLALVALARPAVSAAVLPSAIPTIAAIAPSEATISHTRALTHSLFLPFLTRTEPLPPHLWRASYYDNPFLSGAPVRTADEARVDYDWGDGGAPAGLPVDHFSARWQGDWTFETGQYTFFLYADDGVRLWLDDELIIDAWTPGIGAHQVMRQIDAAGLHQLKLDYFEQTGGAAVRLHWRRTDLYPVWQGKYYNQPWVEGDPLYRRDDGAIQFDWGLGCPPNLPCDAFSVAWNATRLFEPGTHRFFLYADEGYQLYVDGNLVSEGGWYDGQEGGAVDVVYTLEAAGLTWHHVTYNFHDRGTLAEARLWTEYLERPTWFIEFYDNTNLSGTPVIEDPDGEKIFFDWGYDKPRKAMPSGDNFSIRWSGQRYFHSGTYRFGLYADDGARLWVDGELLIDGWYGGAASHHGPVKYLDEGYHDVILEYYEVGGLAEIRFWWE